MDEFYNINQTAIALKVHPLTVRRYIRQGKLKAYRAAGNIRVSVNDLRAFLQNFIPRSKQVRAHLAQSEQTSSKEFSFTDPLLSLKGKGLSMSKLDQG